MMVVASTGEDQMQIIIFLKGSTHFAVARFNSENILNPRNSIFVETTFLNANIEWWTL